MTVMDPLDPRSANPEALGGVPLASAAPVIPANDLAIAVEGVTEVFRPRLVATIAAMANEAKTLVGVEAEERVDVRIGVHAPARGAAIAREVADVLLDSFPAAASIDVQIARIS